MVSDENHFTMSLPHQNVLKMFTFFVEYKKLAEELSFWKLINYLVVELA